MVTGVTHCRHHDTPGGGRSGFHGLPAHCRHRVIARLDTLLQVTITLSQQNVNTIGDLRYRFSTRTRILRLRIVPSRTKRSYTSRL